MHQSTHTFSYLERKEFTFLESYTTHNIFFHSTSTMTKDNIQTIISLRDGDNDNDNVQDHLKDVVDAKQHKKDYSIKKAKSENKETASVRDSGNDKKRKMDKRDNHDDPSANTPKAKKPRVKPEKVKEVIQKIITELVKNYGFGLKEVPMETLAAAVGYKHPRSDAILAAMKELKADGVVIKKAEVCQLTEQGIEEHVEEVEPAENAAAAMEQFWKHLEMKLASNEKSKGDKVLEAATNIWNLLKDGKARDMDEIVGVTSYGMARSTGFGEIMKALRDLGFVHKQNGKVAFTDKLFPFGRPEEVGVVQLPVVRD